MAFFISHTSAVPTDEALVDAYSDFVSSSVAATHPAVVHIEVQGTYPGRSGSGFFISPEGYILTNSHVVHGSRERRVFLADGRKLAADRIGRTSHRDISPRRGSAPARNHPARNAGPPFGLTDRRWGKSAVAAGGGRSGQNPQPCLPMPLRTRREFLKTTAVPGVVLTLGERMLRPRKAAQTSGRNQSR